MIIKDHFTITAGDMFTASILKGRADEISAIDAFITEERDK